MKTPEKDFNLIVAAIMRALLRLMSKPRITDRQENSKQTGINRMHKHTAVVHKRGRQR